MGSAFWAGLRRILWAAAAGSFVGAYVFARFGKAGLWFVLPALAAAAAVASFIANRSRPATPKNAGGEDASLPVLSPLAREVIERLPDPLMLVDPAGRVLFANRAMREVIGVGFERKHVSSLLRTPSVLEALARTSATGEAASVEFVFKVPVERHYQAYTARVGSNPVVTTLLLHDMTSVKRAEQMRADFVANASHELRTPLAAVTGFIETLKGPAKDDPVARVKFLDIMRVEAERMRRLIEDLLSLTRIELNEHVPPLGEVSLETIVREASAALAPLAAADHITVAIDAAEGLPPVAGERDELIQLFQNLIHNAIKYGRENGHVWISLGQTSASGRRGSDAMVTASVRDDGEGIAQEAIPRLTERFYRVDVKRSRERGGTGLGLAIVKHIVNRHHGRLQIESRLGEGSTFTIFLPAARKPADAAVTEML
ncbi:MAG: PAS domain-containing protein [Alphaproteobacteria bacterium]|nr:PAS domain-containing protein [Alphaproteobacteria bacterium]MDE2163321.1 PAS domain-containing protein [Alphaproteobacteria bacterium]MDE2264636.1 PAS domain-containing protein [Alphaproteobacteria bacterium]MDE2499944.1 PAS domain-containing protein [Alphaproteobacteria bacterium]